MRALETALLSMTLSSLVSSLSGCSVLFTETVPDHYETLKYFDCTSTMGLPVADGLFAVSNAASGALALTQSKAEYKAKNDGGNRDIVAGVGLTLAVLGAASAIYGLVNANQCIDAKAMLKAKLLAPPAERTVTPIESPAPPPLPATEPAPAAQPMPPATDAPAPAR